MFACIEQTDRIDGRSLRVVEFDDALFGEARQLAAAKASDDVLDEFLERVEGLDYPIPVEQILERIANGSVVVVNEMASLFEEEYTIGVAGSATFAKVAYVDCLLDNEG